MPPRVVALLLAIVLLWSGVAMTEQRLGLASLGTAQGHSQSAGESQHTDFSGSLDDHQVDDQPLQPHAEHVLDFTVLLDAGHDRTGQPLATIRPLQPADAIRPPPCLEGPQRPPCAAITFLA